MGRMPGRRRDGPGGFAGAHHRRSLAGTAFSATGEGFGAVARAGTPAMRKLQPVPKCICHSLVAQALRPAAGHAQWMLRTNCRLRRRATVLPVPSSRLE